MNLHKEITRRKLMLALLVASVFLWVACVVVGQQRELINAPSVPAAVLDEHSTDGSDDITPTDAVGTTSNTDAALSADASTTTPSAEPESATTTTPATAPTTTVTTPVDNSERFECSGRLTVTSDTANVRTDADKDAQWIATIYKDESYEVIAQKPSSGRILWFEIRLDENTTGYVAASYVKYDGKVINGKAYLTFDDGPSANTTRILDTLDKYGVKATFFVIYRANQEATYRRIVESGHTLALHSYTHSYSQIYKSTNAFYNDIRQLSDAVYDITGVRSNILRFPGGSSNTISQNYCKGIMSELTRDVGSKGYLYYDWDVDSGDASGEVVPADQIINNIKNGISNRRDAVILMHDAKAKTTTADALPQIIEYLQGKGYQILPITADTYQVHQRVHN